MLPNRIEYFLNYPISTCGELKKVVVTKDTKTSQVIIILKPETHNQTNEILFLPLLQNL